MRSSRRPKAGRRSRRLPAGWARAWSRVWPEEWLAWGAALLLVALFQALDLRVSLGRAAGGHAVFLGRLAALAVICAALDRLLARRRGSKPRPPLTQWDLTAVLRSLAVWLVALTAYSNLKSHLLLINPYQFDGLLQRADSWLLLGASPTSVALRATGVPLLALAADSLYRGWWVPLAVVLGVALSRRGGGDFRRLVRRVVVTLLLVGLLHLALPAMGPAFAQRQDFAGLGSTHSFRLQDELLQHHYFTLSRPDRYRVPSQAGIADFPAIELALLYLALLAACRRGPRLAVLVLPFVALAWLGGLAFGWHRLLSGIAGVLAVHLAGWIERRWPAPVPAPSEVLPHQHGPPGLAPSTAGPLLAQWPALALIASLQLSALLAVFALFVRPAELLAGQKLSVLLFILFLSAAEGGLLVALNGLLELLASSRRRALMLDALRALLMSALLLLLATSYLKLSKTGLHLHSTELRFALASSRQLLQEALGSEVGSALLLAVGGCLALLLLFVLLRLLRRRGGPRPSPAVASLLALAIFGAAYTYLAYPVAAAFARRFVPEIYWLRGGDSGAVLERQALMAAEPARGAGPAIEAWAPEPPPDPPNVVLVMLESIPWKRFAVGGGRLGSTPHLEALAREAVVFSRPYTTSTHSDYAQVAILSSLHPRKYEQHDFYDRLDYPRTLIWDALRPAGYTTAMFSCQNERWGNMLSFLKTPGLELLLHSPDWPRAPRRGRGQESKVYEETAVDAWIEWLDRSRPGPFFAYLNFQANHFPYEVPAAAARPYAPWSLDFPASFIRYPPAEVPVMLNRFYNAMRYADSQLGRILAELERRGELERTAVIVVSDHGEAFYEHGQPTHGTTLFEEQVRSLLLMRLPGEAPRQVEEPVSLLDVAPTLLAYLGLPSHGNFQGRDDILQPSYRAEGRPFLFTIQGLTREDGLLLDGWKYSINWDRRERRLFDLEADAEEQVNLLDERPDRAAELQQRLLGLLRRQLDYYRSRGWQQGRYAAPLP